MSHAMILLLLIFTFLPLFGDRLLYYVMYCITYCCYLCVARIDFVNDCEQAYLSRMEICQTIFPLLRKYHPFGKTLKYVRKSYLFFT